MTFSPSPWCNRLQSRIEAVMRPPHPLPASALNTLLLLLSWGYGAITNRRQWLYDHRMLSARRLPAVVISVGNLSVGGTGKTPFTVYLAGFLRQAGRRVAIITRGYGGNTGRRPIVVSDGRSVLTSVQAAGDEAVMMAEMLPQIPVVAGPNRYAAGQAALQQFNPEIILLDDAFQHRALVRDLDLVLLDGTHPLGNGQLLPRGLLREPHQALQRAHALILTRCHRSHLPAELQRSARGKPVFYTYHAPYIHTIIHPGSFNRRHSHPAPPLHGPVFGFSGIADNHRFHQTLCAWHRSVCGFEGFTDHHDYRPDECRALERKARQCGAAWLATTHKDYVRLAGRHTWQMGLIVMGVRIAFHPDSDAAFKHFILAACRSFPF